VIGGLDVGGNDTMHSRKAVEDSSCYVLAASGHPSMGGEGSVGD
jgi:hypothetical protein